MASLESLNIRICPHLWATDETINSLFSFDYQRIFELVSTRSCRNDEILLPYIKCVSCDTSISFDKRHISWPKNGKAVCLDMKRNFES